MTIADAKYKKVDEYILSQLTDIVGSDNIFSNKSDLESYAHDETEDLIFYPEVVVLPANTKQVSAILQLCNAAHIPVTPRGGGTGLSGGALAVHEGVILSMEKFDKIINIDEDNLQATVEPGVINEVFQNAVKEKGLFYPPDPASKGSCFLGGNLAECAGGPKAVKYGVTRDYVLNLEVVLPTGEIIVTGANVLKNSTGYNLTHLMIGSEGTLGVITKIVFKLLPFPRYDMLLLVPFNSAEKACESVSAVFRAGLIPSAMEFMERDAIVLAKKFVDVNIDISADTKAHLIIEVDGNNPDLLMRECEDISDIMNRYECGDILFADTSKQKNELWQMRRAVGEAVKAHSVYKEEDTVVPRAALPKLLKGVKEIGVKYGFNSVCYGHAGDGNLHVNILKEKMSDDKWNDTLQNGIRDVFNLCVKLGGTISGEHGIGLVQKEYLPIALSKSNISIQQQIKHVFDPNNILNPGKIFPAN
jgi:glycolate oxidase subunit GlcD